MAIVFIGIGSNLGDRIRNCKKALMLLEEGGVIIRRSSLYETEPWGRREQGLFINCVAQMETGLGPWELLEFLQGIESKMGRDDSGMWGPRIIDLDILLYDDRIIPDESLTIPHPHLHRREFALAPLSEIAPDIIHPALKRSIADILSGLAGAGSMNMLRKVEVR